MEASVSRTEAAWEELKHMGLEKRELRAIVGKKGGKKSRREEAVAMLHAHPDRTSNDLLYLLEHSERCDRQLHQEFVSHPALSVEDIRYVIYNHQKKFADRYPHLKKTALHLLLQHADCSALDLKLVYSEAFWWRKKDEDLLAKARLKFADLPHNRCSTDVLQFFLLHKDEQLRNITARKVLAYGQRADAALLEKIVAEVPMYSAEAMNLLDFQKRKHSLLSTLGV